MFRCCRSLRTEQLRLMGWVGTRPAAGGAAVGAVAASGTLAVAFGFAGSTGSVSHTSTDLEANACTFWRGGPDTSASEKGA